jgi:hypothetical protein
MGNTYCGTHEHLELPCDQSDLQVCSWSGIRSASHPRCLLQAPVSPCCHPSLSLSAVRSARCFCCFKQASSHCWYAYSHLSLLAVRSACYPHSLQAPANPCCCCCHSSSHVIVPVHAHPSRLLATNHPRLLQAPASSSHRHSCSHISC